MDITALKNKISGSVFGATIGDCLGAPTENLTENDIIKIYNGIITNYVEPKNYLYGKLKKGQWTDDTEQAFFIIDSLEENGVNLNKFSEYLINWKNSNPPDIGPTTYRAIEKLEKNDFSGVGNSSCGASMRIYPLALIYYNNLDKLKEEIIKVSKITHNNKTAIAGALSIGFFVSNALLGLKDFNLLDNCYNFIKNIDNKFGEKILEIKNFENTKIDYLFNYFGTGLPTEEVVPSAIGSYLLSSNYKTNLIKCVNVGGDTDSLACMYGAISGAYYGYNHIAENCNNLINNINNKEIVYKYCDKLLNLLNLLK